MPARKKRGPKASKPPADETETGTVTVTRGRGSPRAQANQREKYRVFASAYAGGATATQAAIEAGYAKSSANVQGCKLLRHPDVQALVMEERERRLAQVDVTTRWLQEQYIDVYQTARKLDDLSNAHKALDSLAKTIGAFSETVRHEHMHLHALADDELLRRIHELERDLHALPAGDAGQLAALPVPAETGTGAPDQDPQDPDDVPGFGAAET